MNARKYRQLKQAKEADRLGPKGTLPGGILLTVPTRTHGGRCTERTYLIPRTHCRTWKSCQASPGLATEQTSPQGVSGGAAWRGPKKPMPEGNIPDTPTSVWSRDRKSTRLNSSHV